MTRTPSTILKSLRAYVLEHGWTQGTLWRPDGSVCAMGGLYKTLGVAVGHSHRLSTPGVKEVRTYLSRAMDKAKIRAMKRASPFTRSAIASYNDYAIQSIDEFIAWVDAAIALAEADEAPEEARDEARELVTA